MNYELDDVVFLDSDSAETVLKDMQKEAYLYGFTSVESFCTHPFVRLDSSDIMDRKMGWTDLSEAYVEEPEIGIYSIKFPKPKRYEIDLES